MARAYKTERMNITMPPEFKALVDAHANCVNWSAVARRAFEEELRRLESPAPSAAQEREWAIRSMTATY